MLVKTGLCTIMSKFLFNLNVDLPLHSKVYLIIIRLSLMNLILIYNNSGISEKRSVHF